MLFRLLLRGYSSGLAPASRQGEADPDKPKTYKHVPSANPRDRQAGLSHVKDDNPREPDEERAKHHRNKPPRAFNRLVQGRDLYRSGSVLLLFRFRDSGIGEGYTLTGGFPYVSGSLHDRNHR